MSNINVYKDLAKTFAKVVGGDSQWDFDNSEYQLLCMDAAIAFQVFTDFMIGKNDMIFVRGLFISDDNEEYVHYWSEVDGVIFDFTVSQFIDVIEDKVLNIKYGEYIFERENMRDNMYLVSGPGYENKTCDKPYEYFKNNTFKADKNMSDSEIAKTILGK